MDFNDFETEGRRLCILRILSRRTQFTTNEYSLNDELKGSYAHIVSTDRLHNDLAWLDEQDLIILQRPRVGWIATLTGRGSDVASGIANVPGVAKPRPGA